MTKVDEHTCKVATTEHIYVNQPLNEMVELIDDWTANIDNKSTHTIVCHPIYKDPDGNTDGDRWEVTITTRTAE